MLNFQKEIIFQTTILKQFKNNVMLLKHRCIGSLSFTNQA